jgi:hypothetical protein
MPGLLEVPIFHPRRHQAEPVLKMVQTKKWREIGMRELVRIYIHASRLMPPDSSGSRDLLGESSID